VTVNFTGRSCAKEVSSPEEVDDWFDFCSLADTPSQDLQVRDRFASMIHRRLCPQVPDRSAAVLDSRCRSPHDLLSLCTRYSTHTPARRQNAVNYTAVSTLDRSSRVTRLCCSGEHSHVERLNDMVYAAARWQKLERFKYRTMYNSLVTLTVGTFMLAGGAVIALWHTRPFQADRSVYSVGDAGY
jgi:hypothetical protein